MFTGYPIVLCEECFREIDFEEDDYVAEYGHYYCSEECHHLYKEDDGWWNYAD